MKCMKYIKRSVAMMMISLVLAGTTGNAYITAKAAGVVESIGGAALFDFMLGLFGVSMAVDGGSVVGAPESDMYMEYLEFLQSEGYAGAGEFTYEDWTAYTNGNVVTINNGLINSMESFLEEKIGALNTGGIQTVYENRSFYEKYGNPDDTTYSFFNRLKWIATQYGDRFIGIDITKTGEQYRYFRLEIPSYLDLTNAYLHVYNCTDDRVVFRLMYYDSNGNHVSTSTDFSFYCYALQNNEWKGVFPGVCSEWKNASFTKSWTNVYLNLSIPCLIFNDCPVYESNKEYSLKDSLLRASTVLGDYKSAVSFGSYNEATVNSLIGKTITKTVIDTANASVSEAITANTITDAQTGELSYTDAIADAVAKAVAQALTDAGVIDKPGTGTGEGTGEGEGDKDLPVAGDILAFLTGFKDSVLDGFAKVGDWIMDIPQTITDAFADIGGVLDGILDAVIAVPDALAEKIQGILNGDSSEEPPDNNSFTADLSSLFPFCIPFDLIACFRLFVAEPEVPIVEVPIHFGIIDYDYTFVISLEKFEPVAEVFRTMMLILYIIGLVTATRSLIRG